MESHVFFLVVIHAQVCNHKSFLNVILWKCCRDVRLYQCRNDTSFQFNFLSPMSSHSLNFFRRYLTWIVEIVY